MNNDKKTSSEIESIYNEYLKEMNELRIAQNKLIQDYASMLEEKKMENLRKKINN